MNIDSLALYMTFSGLLASTYQLRQSFLQQRMIFEDSIKKEYFDITFNLDSVRLQVERLTANTNGQTIKITDSYLTPFANVKGVSLCMRFGNSWLSED